MRARSRFKIERMTRLSMAMLSHAGNAGNATAQRHGIRLYAKSSRNLTYDHVGGLDPPTHCLTCRVLFAGNYCTSVPATASEDFPGAGRAKSLTRVRPRLT